MLANGHKGTKPASALAAAPTPLAICAWKQQFPVPCTSHRAVGFVYASYSIADHLANGPATAEQIATIDPRALRSARKWQLLRRWRRDRNVWHRRDVIARIIV